MSTPEPAAPYRTLPAAQLGDPTVPLRWLLADLFLVGAAGILGGAPKTGKSFFALELAVAVASATAAAGRFAVPTPGPVLLCAAEDPPAGGIAGHGLRGSSDLHAFGDTNLYLRRTGPDAALELRIEHRAAACPPPLRLHLHTAESATGPIARFVCDDALPADPLRDRVLALVGRAAAAVATDTLRTTLGVRKQTLLAVLQRLAAEELVRRAGREGWVAARPVPVPHSMGGTGNAPTG